MKIIAYKIETYRKRGDSTLLLHYYVAVRCRFVVTTVSYYFITHIQKHHIHTHTHTHSLIHVSVIIVCIHRQVRDIMVYYYIMLLTMGRNGVWFEDQSFTAMLLRIKIIIITYLLYYCYYFNTLPVSCLGVTELARAESRIWNTSRSAKTLHTS